MFINGFKQFFENKQNQDLQKLLNKLPKKHKHLIKDMKFNYTGNNTLNGDKKHVGVIHKDKITVAAPWHYSREFTTLHEIAHMIWDHILSDEQKKKWSKLIKKNKSKLKKINMSASSLNQNDEEIFSMCYANYYSKHKIITYFDPEWMKFIKSISS